MIEEKSYFSGEEDAKTQAACLNRIYRKVQSEGMSSLTLEELRGDIDHITGVYHIDSQGVVLLAAILEKAGTNNPADDEDLAQYLGCTNIEFIRYHAQLRQMEKAGIIWVGGRRGNRRCYGVTMEMMKAVESDGEFKPVKMSGLTPEEFFSAFRKYFGAFRSDSIDADRLLEELDSAVRFNDHLSFCRKVLDSALYTECSETERRIFFYLCHRFVTHGNKAVEIDILTNFTGFMEDDDCLKRHIANQTTAIQHNALVTFANEDGFVDTSSLALSDKVKADFFCEVELAPEETVRHRDIIPVETIKAKDLFFNESEGAQVARLENLLDADNFREVQKRLLSSGMRKGFNAIFYGETGTGKTASVYELARRSGRDIFRVDVARLKSKWVGESEKSVRSAFKMYRSLCRGGKKAPILLFNEADAVFSKRIENVEESVDQMNNAIQNILLEELESIEGILIATTNLLDNLDPAFERRFIFKVEFHLPEKESRAKIWKSMIPSLSEEDAATLAGEFSFSGGNIENIARKSTVEYVLSGNEPTLSSLEGYCREELLDRRKHAKIGF